MYSNIPNDIAEGMRSKILSYSEELSSGVIPKNNLSVIKQQYTALTSLRFRRKLPTCAAKRIAKHLVNEYFEHVISEINK
jgi:hypothetical protein